MKVAVVTPYYRETDEVLRTAMDSVRNQTYPDCRHYMVADGFPNPLVDAYGAYHIRLPTAHGDTGNLGRCIGAFAAISAGVDAIAFLDADNWYRPDHISRMAALHGKTGAVVCTSGRSIHRQDGSLLRDRCRENDGERFADTSCLFFTRPAFDLLSLWGLQQPEYGAIGDRLVWRAIRRRGVSRAHDPEPSVAFRTQYAPHYRNEPAPSGAKTRDEVDRVIRAFRARPLVEQEAFLHGTGGAFDVPSLAAVTPPPANAIRVDLLNGTDKLTLEVYDDNRTRSRLNELFKQGHYRPVKGLSSPRRILDIGAGTGLAAGYFRLVYPDAEIVCVEPNPFACALLSRNSASIGRCNAVRLGLHLGTAVRPFHMQNNDGPSPAAAISSAGPRQLMLDANEFLELLPNQQFDLVKIDTGGSEIPIALSLRHRFPNISILLVELHSAADRQLLDSIMDETHFTWRADLTSPHRTNLCYVSKALRQHCLPDKPL